MFKSIATLFLLLIVGLGNVNAQTKFTTGDDELDKTMGAVTKYGRANGLAFQDAIIGKYEITKEQAQSFSSKLSAGDLLLVFEIAVELNKSKEEITEFYIANRIKKNWSQILKELKIDDQSFEKIKNRVVNNGII